MNTVRDSPPPEKVIVPLREPPDVFAAIVTITTVVPGPPDCGWIVIQKAFVVADHGTFDSIVMGKAPPDGGGEIVGGEILKTVPVCVTLMVRVIPPPNTVTAAVRWLGPPLGAAFRLIDPLLLPLAGVTVSQL